MVGDEPNFELILDLFQQETKLVFFAKPVLSGFSFYTFNHFPHTTYQLKVMTNENWPFVGQMS